VKPDQYHEVLLALDQALQILEGSAPDHSPGDQELIRHLAIIRSQVLKAESGHPFPRQTLIPSSPAAEPASAMSSSELDAPEDPAVKWSKRIRVLVADDHEAVRSILRALLAAEKDFDVIAEAANGREAVELASACRPDIIIMDLNMPVLDGISATREALRASPDTRVIVFSANRELASLRKSADAGAVGYLCKPANRKTLIGALRDIHRGKTAFQDLEVFPQAQLR
jgi:CheY-like chemotaxis protein